MLKAKRTRNLIFWIRPSWRDSKAIEISALNNLLVHHQTAQARSHFPAGINLPERLLKWGFDVIAHYKGITSLGPYWLERMFSCGCGELK